MLERKGNCVNTMVCSSSSPHCNYVNRLSELKAPQHHSQQYSKIILVVIPLMLCVKVGDCACHAHHGPRRPRHLPLSEKEEQNSEAEQQDRRGGGEAKNQRR